MGTHEPAATPAETYRRTSPLSSGSSYQRGNRLRHVLGYTFL